MQIKTTVRCHLSKWLSSKSLQITPVGEGDTWEKNFTMVSIELPWCSLVVQTVENMPTMQETWLLYLEGGGGEMPWRKAE